MWSRAYPLPLFLILFVLAWSFLAVLYRVDSALLLHMFCPASFPGTAHYTLAVFFFLVPYLA